MSVIREIHSNATFLVRHPVLRAGKPIETCQFDGDNLPSTKHFGIFIDDDLIGVISVYKNNHFFFKNSNAFQIRGMAVLKDYQKKGFGKILVKYCEKHVVKQNSSLLWFNARKNAVGFYEKLEYKIIGDAFEIEDVGTHYVMFKNV